jgi:hypothetical protein
MDEQTKVLLAKMHREFAEKLLEKLRAEEPISAAEMNVIRQFLKDNEIDATRETNPALGRLAGEFGLPSFADPTV